MWIVCGALRSAYEDRLSTDERALMASTRCIVRDVVIRGEATDNAGAGAARLSEQWYEMTSEREAEMMPGQCNT
jgi:hypothetical protein